MRKLQNQWGDRNPQCSKSTKGDWICFWLVVVIGAIVTVLGIDEILMAVV